ncbi:MAG: hypothetical protein GXP16_05905 [Gammaproteobacteria bacterium]|nr:hypothetical protein [Gammaproteobacteria bacterium]
MKILRRSIGFILAAVVLSGCSIKMAYNNMDRLVRWQVNDYVSLDSTQEEFLETQLNHFMSWHRRSHLPLYADYVVLLSSQLTDHPNEASLKRIFAQLSVWSDEVEARLLPTVIGVLANLSDIQVSELASNMQDNNTEMAQADGDASIDEIQARWADDLKDSFSRFAGRLTASQKSYLKTRSRQFQPDGVLWAQYRTRWQADLLLLLKQREDLDALTLGYQGLVERRESYYGEVLSNINEQNNILSRQVAAHLLANMSAKQNARFVESMEDLAQDFRELATQS